MTSAADIEDAFEFASAQRNEQHITIEGLNERWTTLKGEADSLRSTIKAIEAEMWANEVFDGKNERIREAQFALACNRNPSWRDADEALRGTLNDIQSCEKDIDLRHRALRAKELQMQFRIEQMAFLTTPRYYKEV